MISNVSPPAAIGVERDVCSGCPGGCMQPALEAAQGDSALQPPNAAALNAVVGVLFGGPLFVLCLVVAVLDLTAMAIHPLYGLALVLLTLAGAAYGIATQRAKLLYRLQV